MTTMEPIPRAVDASRATSTVSAQAQVEARRLRHHYLGPEHLLLGLLRMATTWPPGCCAPTA
jgi:hypothetical protein